MTRLLLVLTLILTLLLPWRLLVLSTEMFWVAPGQARFLSGNARFWDAVDLETRLLSLGWSTTYTDNVRYYGQPAYGLTSPQTHSIRVDASLEWSARYAVLTHEAGHTMQPFWVETPDAECFATGVAALLSFTDLREHARHIAPLRWTCLGFFLTEAPAIYHAAAVLQD